jgi:hypothetical protein
MDEHNVNNVPVPSYNLVLRNPHYNIPGHPQGLIKVMLIQKIDDPRIDPAIEQLVLTSGFDEDAEDIYLNTLIDTEDKGFSSVINGEQRVNIFRRFVLDGWKPEEFN